MHKGDPDLNVDLVELGGGSCRGGGWLIFELLFS